MGKVKESDQARQQSSSETTKSFELELIILKEAITNDNEILLETTNTINR